jgi:hypothetical protein
MQNPLGGLMTTLGTKKRMYRTEINLENNRTQKVKFFEENRQLSYSQVFDLW